MVLNHFWSIAHLARCGEKKMPLNTCVESSTVHGEEKLYINLECAKFMAMGSKASTTTTISKERTVGEKEKY